MKKTVLLTLAFGVLMVVLGALSLYTIQDQLYSTQLYPDDRQGLVVHQSADLSVQTILPYYSQEEEVYYFLLPSYGSNYISYRPQQANAPTLTLDGQDARWPYLLKWQEGQVYQVEAQGRTYPVKFLRSANLPAVFVSTQSGSLEYLNKHKLNQEPGAVTVVNAQGAQEYSGGLEMVSGRGNSTFALTPQRSYSIKLEKSFPLCGLREGKKWNLVTTYFQNDLLRSRLVCRMAQALDMRYQVNFQWVDLYINQEYHGVYLLFEPVEAGEGRVDIRDMDKETKALNPGAFDHENYFYYMDAIWRDPESLRGFYPGRVSPQDLTGGYIVERTPDDRLELNECYFRAGQSEYYFALNSPKYATQAQVDYIAQYMDQAEQAIAAGDGSCWNYLDIDSFAQQFVIDKLSMEIDAMYDSKFLVKEQGDGPLYSGPLWDYDRTFGATEFTDNYTLPLGGVPNGMDLWYDQFRQDPAFMERCAYYIERLRPLTEELVDHGIDQYAEYLSAARKMNALILQGNYTDLWTYPYDYEAQIQYLKSYLANRYNFMAQRLLGQDAPQVPLPPSTGESHTVTLQDRSGQVLSQIQVTDGDPLPTLPEYDPEVYRGWTYYGGGRRALFPIPVYGDLTLVLVPNGEG